MEITPVEFDLDQSNLTCNVKCGQCRHLKHVPAPGQKQTCFRLGIIEEGKPCRLFSPDPEGLKLGKNGFSKMLIYILSKIPVKQLHLLAAFLLQEARTRRQGFMLGQEVYAPIITAGDYVRSYRKVYVAAADKRTGIVFLSAQKDGLYRASVKSDRIVLKEDWPAKRKELYRMGKIEDPKTPNYYKKGALKNPGNYVPPTIDDNPVEKEVLKKKKVIAPVDAEIQDGMRTFRVRTASRK